MKCIVFGIAVASLGLGQQPAVRPAVVDQQLASVANLPAHKISANDLIGLSVYDAPELTRTVRVGPDGQIDLPLLKKPIHADGLLPNQLEGAIATALKAEDVLVRPLVTVTVLAYNSRHVSVMGSVTKPLSFEVIGETRILDALAKAEGTTPLAGPDLLLSRSGQPGVVRINLKDLISGNDPALNVVLDGGEEIRVPEALKIYVVGNVKKPGAFPVRDNSDITILKLLAQVEGVTSYAQNIAWIYRTDPQTGRKNEIPVELKKILARTSPDITLLADDVLYVPDNVRRRNAIETAKTLAAFGNTAVAALIYSGKF